MFLTSALVFCWSESVNKRRHKEYGLTFRDGRFYFLFVFLLTIGIMLLSKALNLHLVQGYSNMATLSFPGFQQAIAKEYCLLTSPNMIK